MMTEDFQACASSLMVICKDVSWTGPIILQVWNHIKFYAGSLQGTAAYRLLTEPEHHRMRHVGERDTEDRAAEDPVMACSGEAFRYGPLASCPS